MYIYVCMHECMYGRTFVYVCMYVCIFCEFYSMSNPLFRKYIKIHDNIAGDNPLYIINHFDLPMVPISTDQTQSVNQES